MAPEHIHFELFYGYEPYGETEAAREYIRLGLTLTLSGCQHTVDLRAGDKIPEGALQTRPDAPYACMGGACGTCRAKLTDGTVDMDHNYALNQTELEAGYVLTCQSRPTSPTVTVDFDAQT